MVGLLELLKGGEGAVVSPAGGIDDVLEASEAGFGMKEGLTEGEFFLRLIDPLEGGLPDLGLGGTESAEGPFAGDELVYEETGGRGGGAVVVVVFAGELVEGEGVLGGEDLGFGVDAGFEVGGDDAGLAFLGDGAVGELGVAAVGGELTSGGHEKLRKEELGVGS